MKKRGTEYFKTVRYICMVFVIALGLMTIVGTGGGGGGSGGDSSSSTSDDLKSDILTKAEEILPAEELSILEEVLDDASDDTDYKEKLEELDNSIDSFEDAVSAHQEEQQKLSLSKAVRTSKALGTVIKKNIADTKALLIDIFGNIINDDGKRAFLNAGMGFNREVLGGAGGSLAGAYIVGGTASIESGTGVGKAYDFLNFTSHEYMTQFCSGSAGVVIGVGGSVAGELSVIISDGWMFGFQKDEQYSGGPLIGEGASIGCSAITAAGLGISGGVNSWRGREGSCSLSGCNPLAPYEQLTDRYGFSYAVKASVTGGPSCGVFGNLSLSGTYSCNGTPLGIKDFLDGNNPSRLDTTIAGFKMAKDLIGCNGGATGSILTLPAAATAFLYGLLYDENLIDQLEEEAASGWHYTREDVAGSCYYPWGSTELTENTLQEKFSVNNAYGSVLTGDVTGNGYFELIYVSGDQLKIYDGTGNLLHNVTLGLSNCSVSMLEDINSDGVLDIGIGTGGTSDLKTYFYDGQGNLLKTLSKSAGYDCSMRPAGLLGNGDFVISLNAGYSHSNMYRAFAVYDKDTGSEKWCYKVGPAFGITSIADFDGDGMLDFANEAHTVHNGCNADGYNSNGTTTTDGDIWLIVVDEQGNEKFSRKYSSPSDGNSRHYFVDLDHDGVMEILGFEGHDPTYYNGTSEIHLFDQDGQIAHTFAGSENAGWSFTITDIDGNGKDEVIASNYPGGQSLYVLDHNLAMQNSSEIAGRVQLSCDLNGDGNIEVVLLDDDGNLKVIDKNLQVLDTINVGSHGTVIAGDMDQDGIVELICMTRDHGIHVFSNSK